MQYLNWLLFEELMLHNMSNRSLILSLLIWNSRGARVLIDFWSIWCKSADTISLRTTGFSGLYLAAGFGLSWTKVKPELSLSGNLCMSFEPNKTRDCKYYVYNQSKTGCTSSRLIQIGIEMLPDEILISVWLLLMWYDME